MTLLAGAAGVAYASGNSGGIDIGLERSAQAVPDYGNTYYVGTDQLSSILITSRVRSC
jgi:hypothetical protein